MQSHTVDYGTHRMFSDAEVQIPPGKVVAADAVIIFQISLGRGSQVGRSAD